MLLETLSTHMQITNPGGNVTGSSITEPACQETVPIGTGGGIAAGDGIMSFGDGGGYCANAVKLVPYGVGSNGNTFSMNVYGWYSVIRSNTQPILWVPILLASFTCTLDSSCPGVGGSAIPSTSYFCNTIALVTGNQGTDVDVVSPGGSIHEIAHVVVDAKGARIVEVRFGTGGSATSCNAIGNKQ